LTQGPIDEHEELPWTARVYAMLPMPPLRVGVGIGALLLTALVVSEWALGRFDPEVLATLRYDPNRDLRIAIIHCLLFAYAPTAYVVLIHRTRRTWLELHGLLGVSRSDTQAAMRRVGHRNRWLGATFVVSGLLLWVFATYASSPDDPFAIANITPEVWWARTLGPFLVAYLVLFSTLIVESSWLLSSSSSRIPELDLLNPDQIAPFKSQALTHSLVIFGMAACASPFGFEAYLLGLSIGIWIFTIVVAAVGLLLPLVGIRRLIRSTRSRELKWCDAELRSARDEMKGREEAGQAGRFGELYAYRQRLGEVSEWPLDAPSFVRFSLYLLIPLGSWLGGALVERLVDAVVQ
jgi:hypothetical protein